MGISRHCRHPTAAVAVALLLASTLARADGPTTSPATQPLNPADRDAPKRVVYVLMSWDLSNSGQADIRRAVDELPPNSLFNVIVMNGPTPHPYGKRLVEAMEINKKKFREWKWPASMGSKDWLGAIRAASAYGPDAIWLVGSPGGPPEDEDAWMAQLPKALRGHKTRVNTTYNAIAKHFLWRIAHETGGVCVDQSGNPIRDEPPKPQPPRAAPPPRPSRLRDGEQP